MKNSYTYAVARIRALEVSLFSDVTIEQLITMPDLESCIGFLEEKGWGNGDGDTMAEMLTAEERKIWQVVKELNVNMESFDVLMFPYKFHNLKAAIKEAVTGNKGLTVYYEDTVPSGTEIRDIVTQKNFDLLPGDMKNVGKEAYERMVRTGDGQLCDVLVDRACLERVYETSAKSDIDIVKNYGEALVAIADIKMAVRCEMTGKPIDFMEMAMAPCESLSIGRLAGAALTGLDAIAEYLSETSYAEGGTALSESLAAFELWCDNRMIETIKSEKYRAFTIGPVIAYVIARLNEIKTVRIILSGKESNLPEDSIRGRVRKMYV